MTRYKGGFMFDLMYTFKDDDQPQILSAKSVGFDLEKGKVHIWCLNGPVYVLDKDLTEYVLVLEQHKGGEQDE